MPSNVFTLAAALLLAIGIAVGGWFVGDGFFEGRKSDRYVTVKGLAERDVMADREVWPLRFVATGKDLTTVQQKIVADAGLVRDCHAANGFPPEAHESQSMKGVDSLDQQYHMGQVERRFNNAEPITLR